MKVLSITIQMLWPMQKILGTNKWTDKWMGQKLYALGLSMQGHNENMVKVVAFILEGVEHIVENGKILVTSIFSFFHAFKCLLLFSHLLHLQMMW